VPFHLIEERQCRSVVGEKGGALFFCGEPMGEDSIGSCCGKCARRMYVLPKLEKDSQPEKGDDVGVTTGKRSLPSNRRGRLNVHTAPSQRGEGRRI
jgi:hypothetical protein